MKDEEYDEVITIDYEEESEEMEINPNETIYDIGIDIKYENLEDNNEQLSVMALEDKPTNVIMYK